MARGGVQRGLAGWVCRVLEGKQMQAVVASIVPWASLAFFVVAAFLSLGVNLLPSAPYSRIALAVVGAVLLFGGVQTF